MIYTELTNTAIKLAYKYHHGQKDKAGLPYFTHVFHVAEQMDDELSTCVALLHDTLEDTQLTEEELRQKFPREVVEAVKLLTHDKHTHYMDYVRQVAKNPIARKVKIADLTHNLDATRFAGTGLNQNSDRSAQYRQALLILQD